MKREKRKYTKRVCKIPLRLTTYDIQKMQEKEMLIFDFVWKKERYFLWATIERVKKLP